MTEAFLAIAGGLAAIAGLLFAAFTSGERRAAAKAVADREAQRAIQAAERARLERELADRQRRIVEDAARENARIRAETERRVAEPVTVESADRLHAEIDEELRKP